jgi:hypothetical protein
MTAARSSRRIIDLAKAPARAIGMGGIAAVAVYRAN